MDGIFWYTFEGEKYIAGYLMPNVAKTSKVLMCKTIIIAQRVPGLRTLGSNLILLQDGAFTFEI